MVSTLSLMFHTYFSHSDTGIPGLTVLHFIVPHRSCVFFACKRMMTHSTAIRTSLWWSGREPAVSLKYVCTLFYEVNTNLFCYFNGGREKLESTCLRGEPVGPDYLGQWQGSSTFANFKTWDEWASVSSPVKCWWYLSLGRMRLRMQNVTKRALHSTSAV